MVLPNHIEVVPTGSHEQTVSCGDEYWIVRATAVPTEYEVTDHYGGQIFLHGLSLDDAVLRLLYLLWSVRERTSS
jgi:hypothetical protein